MLTKKLTANAQEGGVLDGVLSGVLVGVLGGVLVVHTIASTMVVMPHIVLDLLP